MYSLLLSAATAFTLAFALTPLCRNLALRWGFVDKPDKLRKLHDHPIPRVGGIPIALAYVAGLAILAAVNAGGFLQIAEKFFPAAGLIFLTGLLDDLFTLKPWQKLVGQLAAASAAIAAGVHIDSLGWHHLPVWCSVLVTILWLILCSNAFNLIDGVDGLAAGVGLFATATTIMAALIQRNVALALFTIPLAGALLGFLRYNFNPASIFLGDSGSLLIGFLLGCYGILWSNKSATILGMTAPLMALAIPLLDTGLAIVRRSLRGQPIFGADHGHIHHKLLARGFTPRRVALLLYGVCGLSAGLSLLLDHFGGAIIVLFCAGAWIGVQHLGYAEFDMARRMVFTGTFHHLLNARLQLRAFTDDLNAATTPDQYWEVLRRAYPEFGFNEIKLKLGGQVYRHTTNGHHVANTWTIRILLSNTGYVKLSREFDTQAPLIVAPFVDTIGKVMLPRLAGMRQETPLPARDFAVKIQPQRSVQHTLTPSEN